MSNCENRYLFLFDTIYDAVIAVNCGERGLSGLPYQHHVKSCFCMFFLLFGGFANVSISAK
jgi:hypothetical protein